MTLDDFECQNRGFLKDIFCRLGAATQVYIIHNVEPWNYHFVHFGVTVINVLYFIPNSRKSNSNIEEIFVVRFRCIVSAIIYYLVHFWCTVFGETACIPYSIICDILFDGAATSGIGLQRPALTNADWLHWLSCYIFTRVSSRLSHRTSVRLSVCLSVSHSCESVKSGAS